MTNYYSVRKQIEYDPDDKAIQWDELDAEGERTVEIEVVAALNPVIGRLARRFDGNPFGLNAALDVVLERVSALRDELYDE